jgi:hypothetical protein
MLEILRSAPLAQHIVGRERYKRMILVFPVSAEDGRRLKVIYRRNELPL